MNTPLSVPPPSPAGAWRNGLIGLAALLALMGVLYGAGFKTMAAQWMGSENFAHAVLVPPISVWLIWRLRHHLAAMTPAPSPLALLPLLGAGAAWLVGHLAEVDATVHFALVTALISLVPLLFGWAVARALTFPLLFLYFAVPFGEFLYPVLMDWTADFTVAALRLSTIPVYREGLQFIIPSGQWSVIEACSGLRYFVASVMVGALFAYLNYVSSWRRAAFVAVAVLVPIVANWVRAYMIVMIGHLSDNKLAAGVDHLIYGWVFFGVIMFLMFAVGARFADAPIGGGLPEAPQPAAERSEGTSSRALPALLLALVGVLLPALVAHGLESRIRKDPPQLQPWTEPLPWARQDALDIRWQPTLLAPPSASLHEQYQAADGTRVGLYLGYYRQQEGTKKLVSSWNLIIPAKDEHWAQVRKSLRDVQVAGHAVRVEEVELKSRAADTERQLFWRLYWVDDTWTGDPVRAKLHGLRQSLMARGDDGAALIVHAPTSTRGGAEAALVNFLQDNLPFIERHLRRTQGGSGQ